MMETVPAQQSQAAGEGRPVKVAVTAERDPITDEVRFKLDSDLIEGEDDGGGLVFDQNRDDMWKIDYYIVEFDLDDRTGRGLRFAPDKDEAFWVNTGPVDAPSPPCPTTPSFSDEIHALAVDGCKLIVRNENNTIANFSYSLGFVTEDGNQIRLDPGGENRDGGKI